MPEVQEAARAVSPKIVLCRLFRTVAPDTFTAVFERRQIVLGNSFPAIVAYFLHPLGYLTASDAASPNCRDNALETIVISETPIIG
jgi:hypothetical protein